jgi:hypothetical protein
MGITTKIERHERTRINPATNEIISTTVKSNNVGQGRVNTGDAGDTEGDEKKENS